MTLTIFQTAIELISNCSKKTIKVKKVLHVNGVPPTKSILHQLFYETNSKKPISRPNMPLSNKTNL